MVELDYPDIKKSSNIKMEEGDFGPATQEIKEVSGGIFNYNMKFIMGKQSAFAQSQRSCKLNWRQNMVLRG